MRDECWRVNRRQPTVRRKVELTEALPHALLHARLHAEGREVDCRSRIREVRRHAQLEVALAVGVQVALAQSGRRQLRAQLLDLGAVTAPRKLALEHIAMRARN